MEIKTFKAKTMRDALDLVRRELGPQAAVLHTREVNGGPIRRLVFGRRYEVAASATMNVPSRLPIAAGDGEPGGPPIPPTAERYATVEAPVFGIDYRAKYREDFRRQVVGQIGELQAMVEKLCEHAASAAAHDLPEAVFRAFTDLIEADVDEVIVREWIDEIRRDSDPRAIADAAYVKALAIELLERDIQVAGPIRTEANKCRLVALVGPTGVGKTTTVAKLAANYRLREKRRVGLITVDTYRVAAVEQLRTYADIIDLPMEVVATPREMREAVARMAHLDLVLMDTAGRSPRDEVKIQELKSMLAEAEPDDVHLVLSSTAGAKSLIGTAEKFADVGTTAMVLTKLDEAHSLGHIVSLVRECRLPVSYFTDGQNVPDDIKVAERGAVAEKLLGIS